ncbi:MAG: C1 family peptidase [Phyllobacteriaceae bacterium]|nr:C1 family peptidase [Phyllobacteriaceae bacterium]
MRSNTVIRQSARRLSPNFQASGARRILNARPDIPDIRDRIYEPALLDLDVTVMPPPEADSPILDQGREGACTGFALAAALNLVKRRRNRRLPKPLPPPAVSARMLYEMAKQHDEWPGENYDGSSVRGVIKGFFHNGVCDETLAPWNPGQKNWSLTVEQAKNARITGLGAYYRLRREILDYHAALNEVGVIVASAQVHRGWIDPGKGFIRKSNQHEGGHAFVIVGYDAEGFLVQNSWGRNWGSFNGRPGIAHWSYSDWAENTRDAWVLRLGVPTPEAFDLTHLVERKTSAGATTAVELREPRRQDIVGHFVHLDDGKLVETGRYATRWIRCAKQAVGSRTTRIVPRRNTIIFYSMPMVA